MANYCPICNSESIRAEEGLLGDAIKTDCCQCGSYSLSRSILMSISSEPDDAKVMMSYWIRWQNILGTLPKLDSYKIDEFKFTGLPGVKERADRLLDYCARKWPRLGAAIDHRNPELIAASCSGRAEEVRELLQFLEEEGHILFIGATQIRITPRGHISLENARSKQVSSDQVFVAMWFDSSMNSSYTDGLRPGIIQAGYQPIRIDRVHHNNKIDDEIIAHIRRSRFLVADFTGHRGGVYFEAGFALGLNLPVIWCCRQDEIDNLHFDVRQFNCIIWENHSELSTALRNRIEATVGKGPHEAVD